VSEAALLDPAPLPPQSYDRRRKHLIIALRTMRDAGETLQRGDSGGKFEPGSRLLSMPAIWHAGPYLALDAALKVLARVGPRHYWNVDQRYISPERTTRNLILNPRGRYFEAVPKDIGGIRQYYAGDELILGAKGHTEVLRAVTDPKARVLGAKTERLKLVRAIVERWDAAVERRPLETGIDFLLSQMPSRISLPKEIREAL
jgi:hypothetical protein